ncbi:GNAT family N-acetyltransferase [Lysinibacillus piscis]|uniref:N-acetyltransferase domain-containing protein n=1 Tax=Lysinibacillus piscis TaxID=2518931 RepID=A0ABQ5NI44_9BACI|nr:GNAT family N-acetyltransferase [Lysinibacillus sp. KH24]GLC88045.1 hypothetical protein LYSBPC_11720 [Lysinibacillus sp. KH24]
MNISIITVSFPLDGETLQEVQSLCEIATQQDQFVYDTVLSLSMASSFESKGFMVLAYEDESDTLVGVASAIDLIGLHTYEWSLVVAPTYRQLGIGTALEEIVQHGLAERGAEGQLAVALEGAPFGSSFIEKIGYSYSFSEATLEAPIVETTLQNGLTVMAYAGEQQELVSIYSAAFGDLPEEAAELIVFNTSTTGRKLWLIRREGVIVGTVTTAEEDDVQWITALAVHPHYERQGIGTALLSFAKNYAGTVGARAVMLDVELDNSKALSVYEKAGFTKVQKIDYYTK